MKVAVLRFPGSNCDDDVAHVIQRVLDTAAVFVFHKALELPPCDAVVLPGGFSYGDYLRAGAMAAHAPIMKAVRAFAERGGPVLGVCNGYQVLCEAGLLDEIWNDVLMTREETDKRLQQVFSEVETAIRETAGTMGVGAVIDDPLAVASMPIDRIREVPESTPLFATSL